MHAHIAYKLRGKLVQKREGECGGAGRNAKNKAFPGAFAAKKEICEKVNKNA